MLKLTHRKSFMIMTLHMILIARLTINRTTEGGAVPFLTMGTEVSQAATHPQ
jgi:hypothetical protein